MATPATWRTGDKLYIDPAVLVGASTSGGRQYVDPDLTGGAAYIDANGRLIIYYPTSTEKPPTMVGTGAFSFSTKRSFSRSFAWASTGTLTLGRGLAKQFGWGATGTFSSMRIVQRIALFACVVALTFIRSIARALAFASSGTFGASRAVMLGAMLFVSTAAFSINRNLARTLAWVSTGTVSASRVVRRTLAFVSTGALTFGRNLARFMGFSATGSFKSTRLILMVKSIMATAIPFIDGTINRIGTDIGVVLRALLFGRRGPVHFRYRFYKSDVSGTTGEELKGVTNASVSMSNFRDHTWELTFDMLESVQIDPLKDYVKLVAQVRQLGIWRSFPLGLYQMRKPRMVKNQAYTRWSLTGRSPEVLLAKDMPNLPYNATAGQDVLDLVRQIIIDRGVPASRIVFPPGGAKLSSGITFDPVTDTAGTYWLRIANTLLNAGGYYALYTDEEGKFTTKKMGSRTVIEADVRMGPDYEPVIVNEVQDNYEDDRFANRVIVFSRNVNDTPPIVAVAENHNGASPASFEQLGRWETKTVNLTTVVTQADAQTMAQAELERASGFYRKVTLQTIPDPRRKPREVYEVLLKDNRGRTVMDGLWDVTSWTLPLTSAPSTMSHEISRVEQV